MTDSFRHRIEQRKFTLLLVSLVGVQMLPVLGGDQGGEFASLLWGVVLLAAVHAAAGKRRVTIIFAALAVIVFGGRLFVVFGAADYAPPVDAGGNIALTIFLGMTAYVVFNGAVRAQRVSSDSIMGAICVYALIGYTWANLYALVEYLQPGSFNLPSHASTGSPAAPEYAFSYYSFVTLTTLGYGDITPISYAARTLSWMEAAVGVTYMATVIAFLVAQVMADQNRRRD